MMLTITLRLVHFTFASSICNILQRSERSLRTHICCWVIQRRTWRWIFEDFRQSILCPLPHFRSVVHRDCEQSRDRPPRANLRLRQRPCLCILYDQQRFQASYRGSKKRRFSFRMCQRRRKARQDLRKFRPKQRRGDVWRDKVEQIHHGRGNLFVDDALA